MKAERLRRFIDLHAWVGMVSGLALFVAFFAGAINVFHHELHHWQEAHQGHEAAAAPADPDAFLQQLVERFPAAAERMFFLPDDDPGAMWFQPGEGEAPGEWRTAHASSFSDDGRFHQAPGSELADFINELHYELGIPGNGGLINIGMTLMGFIAVLYGVALFSGLVIHWPKLRKELFAIRHQGNLRRYWKNLHNLIGVLSFPFHLIMSVTGAAMGMFTVMAIVMGVLVFGPQLQGVIQKETDIWPAVESEGESVAMAPMADYLAAADNALPGMDVGWVEIRGYGDAAGWMDVAGSQPGYLGHHAHVVLDNTMKPLRVSAPGNRTFNFAAISPVYSLHFGDYGGTGVKLLYFAMGLLGAVLFVSGNILWCERRSDRVGPSRSSAFLLRLTLGLCFGVVCGIAVSFLVSKLLPYTPWGALVASAERQVFWGLLVVLVVWSLRASPLRFSGLMLRIAPLLYLAIPVAQFAVEGRHAWQAPDVLLVNLVVLAVAASLWVVRRQFRRRVRLADPHPLWVGRVTREHPKRLTEAEQGR
ncbi:PepSY-associated TM helix domain-containing protein [Alcanivorax sp.]|uniref:PepSY-associated TM helix domain-containing protein n=1 Tax=Alcanivorax sp. TaxID=1872427 RepID=UPI0025C42483|nr:PepSY-associated TM helix domain-containing protein [Alcanivorax sp.]